MSGNESPYLDLNPEPTPGLLDRARYLAARAAETLVGGAVYMRPGGFVDADAGMAQAVDAVITGDDLWSLEAYPPTVAVGLFEARHFVKQPPRLPELAADASRMTEFTTKNRKTFTVHEGLAELHSYLKRGAKDPKLEIRSMARGMLDSLLVIDTPEVQEATAVMAASWKHYLDNDPTRQILAMPEVSRDHYKPKSDSFVLNHILSHFGDEELTDRYRRRIIMDVDHLTAPPTALRAIMAEDWMLTGDQMCNSIPRIRNALPDSYNNCVEIQLIAAPAHYLRDGYNSSYRDLGLTNIPVRAYYRAKPDPNALHGARITGTHSAADYGFAVDLTNMHRRQTGLDSILITTYLTLANIKSTYGSMPHIERLAGVNG